MYIIQNSADEILNIIYGEDHHVVMVWVEKWLQTEINSLMYCPIEKNIKNISYDIIWSVEDNSRELVQLIKNYELKSPGYIYNQWLSQTQIISQIKVIKYNVNSICLSVNQSQLNTDIKKEINRRIMNELDRDSLYQAIQKIETLIDSKNNWTRTEYRNLVNEVLKNHEKELYSVIVKKTKKYGAAANKF